MTKKSKIKITQKNQNLLLIMKKNFFKKGESFFEFKIKITTKVQKVL